MPVKAGLSQTPQVLLLQWLHLWQKSLEVPTGPQAPGRPSVHPCGWVWTRAAIKHIHAIPAVGGLSWQHPLFLPQLSPPPRAASPQLDPPGQPKEQTQAQPPPHQPYLQS